MALRLPQCVALPSIRVGASFDQRTSGNCRRVMLVKGVLNSSQDVSQRARLTTRRVERHVILESDRPLAEYMRLPASQYSVLDAERIERVDENTFMCYVHRFKFFAFEIVPVLLIGVEERPDGCCIKLMSCTLGDAIGREVQLEGSPIVVAQNKKFSASMVNYVSWRDESESPTKKQLISDTTIEVTIEIPSAVSAIPKSSIEATGNQILAQLLRVTLPRFLVQLEKDYHAWAAGDSSRKPLGTGEL